jgi:hypothetical protein
MNPTKSIKTDPFGVIDTRIAMNDSSADGFFPPPFPAFARDDDFARDLMEAETSPKRQNRTLVLCESFQGFDSGRKCPRLELDAAVDTYHLLDGLNHPLDPQNTQASSKSKRQGTHVPQHDTENIHTSHAPQIEKLNFDCFQDSLESGPFGKRKPSKLRHLSSNSRPIFNAPASGINDDQPASDVGSFGNVYPPNLGTLSDRQGQWFKQTVTGLEETRPDLDASASKKPSNSCSGVRCVRFSPIATLPSPPRVMRRPMPQAARKLDNIALYRQQSYEKWRITRPTRLLRTPSPKRKHHPFLPHVPYTAGVRFPTLASLAVREVKKTPPPSQLAECDGAVEVATDNAAENPVVHDLNAPQSTKQHKCFVHVYFSLYRLRKAPRSSSGKVQNYAFEFRTVETDIKSLPNYPVPQFPPEVENTIGPIVVDDLLFHTRFTVTSLAVSLPLAVFFGATKHLTNTQAGTTMLFLARPLFLLMKHIAVLVLSMCGVSFSCRWCPPTGDSE